MTFLYIGIGLVLLFFGGEVLVRGAVGLAQRLGVSPLLIGVTVVAYGTSSPELIVTVDAAIRGAPDIAVGNVVGSNIANILLILGIASMIQPVACEPRAVYRDGSFMVASAFLFAAIAWSGSVRLPGALLMLAVLAGSVVYSYLRERRENGPAADLHRREAELVDNVPARLPVILLAIFAGFAALVVGANFLVDGAVTLARRAGISEAVIGLTLVAVGTSLPELATSVIAAFRRQADVALGNILGSNIFNLLGILGLAGLFVPIPIAPSILAFDIWAMLAVTLLLIPVLITGWRISRIEGTALLGLYILYVLLQFWSPVGAALPGR